MRSMRRRFECKRSSRYADYVEFWQHFLDQTRIKLSHVIMSNVPNFFRIRMKQSYRGVEGPREGAGIKYECTEQGVNKG